MFSLSLMGQLIFDGMAMGLVYVILATGLVLIISTSRILFMAYGAFYTIGAYVTWYVIHNFALPYFASLIIGVSASALIGMLSYVLIFRRLMRSERGFLATLIAAMGLSMMLSQGNILVFGTVARSIPTVFPGIFSIGGISITNAKLVIIIIGISVTALLFWMYEKTKVGRALRAVAFLPEAASLQGVYTNRTLVMSLGIGCALAGFAGGVLAPSYGIDPAMGQNVLWTVMLMTMLGGMDSLPGAVLGGVIIGQLLSFGQFYIGSSIQIIIFLIIGIVLYFRPNGLLGRGINVEI